MTRLYPAKQKCGSGLKLTGTTDSANKKPLNTKKKNYKPEPNVSSFLQFSDFREILDPGPIFGTKDQTKIPGSVTLL